MRRAIGAVAIGTLAGAGALALVPTSTEGGLSGALPWHNIPGTEVRCAPTPWGTVVMEGTAQSPPGGYPTLFRLPPVCRPNRTIFVTGADYSPISRPQYAGAVGFRIDPKGHVVASPSLTGSGAAFSFDGTSFAAQ